jgi:hypothetical protein
LEDAMFNTVAEEIDGFDLGTNAGRASALEAALFPAPSSPTCWMSPLKSLPGEYREGLLIRVIHRPFTWDTFGFDTHTVVGVRVAAMAEHLTQATWPPSSRGTRARILRPLILTRRISQT